MKLLCTQKMKYLIPFSKLKLNQAQLLLLLFTVVSLSFMTVQHVFASSFKVTSPNIHNAGVRENNFVFLSTDFLFPTLAVILCCKYVKYI